jgi:hypothetical protein
MASDSLIGFCEIKRKPDSNKKSKVLYKNGLRFPYRLFRIKRKPKSKPKSAKYFTKTASDSLIGAVEFRAPKLTQGQLYFRNNSVGRNPKLSGSRR